MVCLPLPDTLYEDAISMRPQQWNAEYGVAQGLQALIVAFYEPRVMRRNTADAGLHRGFLRLFLLGFQIAGEEKGDAVPRATDIFSLNSDALHTGKGDMHSICCAVPTTDGRTIICLTRSFIEQALQAPQHRNRNHLQAISLDPFQLALVGGLEEGLHAWCLAQPEIRTQLISGKAMENSRIGEEMIHADMENIAGKLPLQYDITRWRAAQALSSSMNKRQRCIG